MLGYIEMSIKLLLCQMYGPKKGLRCFCSGIHFLCTLATDAAGKLDVLWHDGDTFGMDSAKVGVLKQANQVSLRCFLQSHNSRGLESEISLEVLGDLTDESLEG